MSRKPSTVSEVEQRKPLSLGWVILAGFAVVIAFAVFTGLMKKPLGVDTSYVGLLGTILVIMFVCPMAPRSIKQLGQLVAVVGVAGTLGILLAIWVELTVASGFWSRMLGIGLAGVFASFTIVFSLRRLGIEYRVNVKDKEGS